MQNIITFDVEGTIKVILMIFVLTIATAGLIIVASDGYSKIIISNLYSSFVKTALLGLTLGGLGTLIAIGGWIYRRANYY